MLVLSRVSTLEIASVNVGLIQPLGLHGRSGRLVHSGIRKTPVRDGQTYLSHHGLQGDQQADGHPVGDEGRPVHGGPDQAVYVFPAEHLLGWHGEDGPRLAPGAFGENLTVRGILECDVRPGDVWRWGDIELVVTRPRRPCFKLDMFGGEGTAAQMADTGHCGWYLRVHRRQGLVPTRGVIEVVRHADGPTIAQIFREKMRRSNGDIPDLRNED